VVLPVPYQQLVQAPPEWLKLSERWHLCNRDCNCQYGFFSESCWRRHLGCPGRSVSVERGWNYLLGITMCQNFYIKINNFPRPSFQKRNAYFVLTTFLQSVMLEE
jgi:hypothetical protein